MAMEKQSKAKTEKRKRNPIKSKAMKKGKSNGKRKGKREERKRRSGPRLPSALRKQLELMNPSHNSAESDPDDEGEVAAGDVYEYEEPAPEEESKKNRRFDSVENYEYELPEDFKDEDVPSEDEGDVDNDAPSDNSDDDEDGSKHLRMLEGITGMPGKAFEGKGRKKVVFSDYQGDVTDRQISIEDLLDSLHGKPGYNKIKKRFQQLEKEPMTVQAPLPKVEKEKLERKVAYEHSKKDLKRWEPIVKRVREAPTVYFDEDVDLGYSTVGAIASEFEPRTEFEKRIALLVGNPEVKEAHKNDGARLLELNKVSIEDERDRQNRLAKMRSLLFCHEMKSKHIKKIKSKTYHRLLKKERLKAEAAGIEMDPEVAKENALKQEFKRAEERMTLKHKNRSRWAQRILERGLAKQDEGTRIALAEQLNQHALLTRKMNSMKDIDSDGSSEDEDDDIDENLSEKQCASNLLNRAKDKTIREIEEQDELPKSGVFSLPFMERGLKKLKEEAEEEARIALQEYDASLRQLENENVIESPESTKVSGRKVFGPTKSKPQGSIKGLDSDNAAESSDSEAEFAATDHVDIVAEANNLPHEVQLGSVPIDDNSESVHRSVFKSFDDILKEPGPKTTYEVAIFASDAWKKMKAESVVGGSSRNPATTQNLPKLSQASKDMDENIDIDSDEEMIDGFLSSGVKPDYELPSQADLIHRAFAGDDVEAEFEKDKMEVLNEENPEPEKPDLLPGWGQWTHVQKKKGLPSWMLEEHENAKRKREDALRKRKDANLKHVIISEKIDKKADKLFAKTLPFPYTSKEVYEQSIRVPIGPEYNPAVSIGALNRPPVVKKAGTIIKPIQYEEVDPHEKPEEPKRIVQKSSAKPKLKKAKVAGKNLTPKS